MYNLKEGERKKERRKKAVQREAEVYEGGKRKKKRGRVYGADRDDYLMFLPVYLLGLKR